MPLKKTGRSHYPENGKCFIYMNKCINPYSGVKHPSASEHGYETLTGHESGLPDLIVTKHILIYNILIKLLFAAYPGRFSGFDSNIP